MSSRNLLTASVLLAGSGVFILGLTWVDAISWVHSQSLAFALIAGAILLLGVAILGSLRGLSNDIRLIRDRSQILTQQGELTTRRVAELHAEITEGPTSHVAGQVARLEGKVAELAGTHARPVGPRPERVTLSTVVDAVFVLNLDQDVERWQHTTDMLTRHGISHVRFPATDGRSPDLDTEWDAHVAAMTPGSADFSTDDMPTRSRGTWGYLKTMQKLLTHAIDEGLQRILVLDDDVMLHREFATRFETVWAEVPDTWRMVYLGSAQAEPDVVTAAGSHLYHPGAMANGSYAIMLDSSVFGQALAAVERFDRPFDAGALREIDAGYPDDVFAVTPPLVVADVSTSAIRPGRSMEEHAAKHGWNLDDYEPRPTAERGQGR